MDHQFEEGLFNRHPKVALTLEEVAAELGVDVADVEAVVASGELAVKHVGSKVIVPLISFAEYLGESLPNTTSQMATPELTSTNSTITLVKDDVDMTQGCVTYVKKSDRYLYQLDLGKTPDGKRIRESKSFLSETEAKAALDIRLAQLGQSGQSQNIRNTVVFPKFRRDLPYTKKQQGTKGMSFGLTNLKPLVSSLLAIEFQFLALVFWVHQNTLIFRSKRATVSAR